MKTLKTIIPIGILLFTCLFAMGEKKQKNDTAGITKIEQLMKSREFYIEVDQAFPTGNSSITIYELPVGKYTIEEDTGWIWRYDATYDPDKPDGCTLTAGHNSGSITCTNTLKNDRWLNGFSDVIANIFGIRH